MMLQNRKSGASSKKIPESWIGFFDGNKLQKWGLSSCIIKTNDFLFFFQLILQICDTDHIQEYWLMVECLYYSKLEEWSNLHAYQI